MYVSDIMVKKIITVLSTDKVGKAFLVMVKNKIRHLPVVDAKNKKKLVGFLSDRDVKESLDIAGDKIREKTSLTVSDVMRKKVITVSPRTFVQDAAKLIHEKKIGGLPVVDKGSLMGIITYHDIIGIFIEMMDSLQKSSRIDVEVKNLKEMEKIKVLLESEGCELIGVGLVSEKKNKEVYSFRIKRRDTQPLFNFLTKKGHKVLEHF